MLLYGIIISWESRDIQKEFNQSIMLSLSIGTILFIGAITIPFDFALFSDSTVGVVWFRMLSIYIYKIIYSILFLIVILTGVLMETLIIYVPKFYDFYENHGSGEGISSDSYPTQEQQQHNEKFNDVESHDTIIPIQNMQMRGSALANMLSQTTSNKITSPQPTSPGIPFVSPIKVFSYKDIKSSRTDVNHVVSTKTPHPSSRRVNPYNPSNQASPTRVTSPHNRLTSRTNSRPNSRQNSPHESAATTISSSYSKCGKSNTSDFKTPQLIGKCDEIDPVENFKLEPSKTNSSTDSNF